MSACHLSDGSFIEGSIEAITPDRWRPHGVRYRLAWIQEGLAEFSSIIIMARVTTSTSMMESSPTDFDPLDTSSEIFRQKSES